MSDGMKCRQCQLQALVQQQLGQLGFMTAAGRRETLLGCVHIIAQPQLARTKSGLAAHNNADNSRMLSLLA